MDLRDRKILLGITGGVAAYKACDLARRLQDQGAQVQPILTHGALHFVTPIMLQALTGRPAYVELWDERLDQAMGHIARYGSQHSEAIVTQDYGRAMRFLNEVDAAAVFVNASTRLHDGYQFGLGAEIGISTTRIHARGAMGLEELTSTKFIVLGTGQLRE